jgi:exodeoxyribonuclease VII large subunit
VIALGRSSLSRAQQRLAYLHPRAVIARERAALSLSSSRLTAVWNGAFDRRAAGLQRAAARLEALSPLNVLARGYAIATGPNGKALRSSVDAAPGDAIVVRVRDARVVATVVEVEPVERSG